MKGRWRRDDNSEEGPWEATQPTAKLPARKNVVALYEWRRASDDSRRYMIANEKLGAEWLRAARPLCRVWLLR
jgi:hypothetical protein